MKYILLLLTLFVLTTTATQAQDDNPYARFGHKGKVLKTPQERQQFMLKIPNPDATSEIALVGIAPNEGKYYLFDAANEVIQEDTLMDDELSRFLSVDPLTRSYPWYTPYQFAGNTPIQAIDLDGLERFHYTRKKDDEGKVVLTLIAVEDIVVGRERTGVEWHGNTGRYTYTDIIDNSTEEHIVHSYYPSPGIVPGYKEKTKKYDTFGEALAAPDEDFEFKRWEKWLAFIEGGSSTSPMGMASKSGKFTKMQKRGSVAKNSKFKSSVFKSDEVLGRRVYKNNRDVTPGAPSFVHQSVHKSIRDKVADGWTNKDLMNSGYAPIGPDGKQINLHHLLGKESGPMVELTSSFHSKNKKALHGLIEDGKSFRNDPKLEYQYDKFRKAYWKKRAEDFQ